MSKKMRDWLVLIVLFLVVWFIPTPEGLKPQAWKLFAIFITVIVGFITQPVPMGAISIAGISVVCLTGVLKANAVLAGFGNTTLWLIVSAFFFAKGFEKTGLGRRISYIIIRSFGKKTLSLAYSISIADLILGPAIPSNTARIGGVVFPIVQSLSEAYDSRPGETANKLGAFLLTSIFQADAVISAMFLTSMAANPLIAEFAMKTLDVNITWMGWITATIVPGIIGVILIPIVVYLLMKPEIKETPKAPEIAHAELNKMGPMGRNEIIMLFVFVGALILWITSAMTGIDNTIVALTGVAVMLLTGVLAWDDVAKNHNAWNTFVWTGFIMMLSAELNKSGFITWFGGHVASQLTGMPWIMATVIAYFVYLISHYGFASMTAHVSAMYVALITVAYQAGAPAFVAAFAVAMAANLCGCLTHYGTGPAPIFFGAGYVSQQKWWSVGFIMSLITAALFLGVGIIWWKIIGLW